MFHAKAGVYFGRLSDGSVEVIVKADACENAQVLKALSLSPDSWASVVASVSRAGESAEQFAAAVALHAGGRESKKAEVK